MLVIRANILILDFNVIVFLERRNHAPINAKMIKNERNVNDKLRFVVICSATESVNAS